MKRYTEKELEKMCNERGLKVKFCENVMIITTSVSSWRIFHTGCKVTKLYHENYRGVVIGRKCGMGYHKHKLNAYNTYESVLGYIKNHDKRFLLKSTCLITLANKKSNSTMAC